MHSGLNMSKAFHSIVQSDKVFGQWRDLATRLGLTEHDVTSIELQEPPLSMSEKCFEVLSKWQDEGNDASLKELQKHLKALGCSAPASKLANISYFISALVGQEIGM
jgi:hypothetical protein